MMKNQIRKWAAWLLTVFLVIGMITGCVGGTISVQIGQEGENSSQQIQAEAELEYNDIQNLETDNKKDSGPDMEEGEDSRPDLEEASRLDAEEGAEPDKEEAPRPTEEQAAESDEKQASDLNEKEAAESGEKQASDLDEKEAVELSEKQAAKPGIKEISEPNPEEDSKSVAEEASERLSGSESISVIEESGVYTSKDEVASYLHQYGHLPDNYITKRDAEAAGWDSRKGNLWDVAPGMSIGGSRFGNYEGLLPDQAGRKYYECDIDYEGGYRGAKRIIYSNDGLIFYTEDHYKTFDQLY